MLKRQQLKTLNNNLWIWVQNISWVTRLKGKKVLEFISESTIKNLAITWLNMAFGSQDCLNKSYRFEIFIIFSASLLFGIKAMKS